MFQHVAGKSEAREREIGAKSGNFWLYTETMTANMRVNEISKGENIRLRKKNVVVKMVKCLLVRGVRKNKWKEKANPETKDVEGKKRRSVSYQEKFKQRAVNSI